MRHRSLIALISNLLHFAIPGTDCLGASTMVGRDLGVGGTDEVAGTDGTLSMSSNSSVIERNNRGFPFG
jgi:hypothetical protein